jgi:THO complex subunit 1
MYQDQVLKDEDAKWIVDMKKTIADYLKLGFEGPYFLRMVETIIMRDKNWVRWKQDSCPPIELPPISPETFEEAKDTVLRMSTNKRLRPTPLGSLDLGFLDEEDEDTAWAKLKNPARYTVPDLKSYQRKLADIDLDMDMATSSSEKAALAEAKASVTWRALRMASKTKLATLDKITDDDRIDAIFEDGVAEKDSVQTATVDEAAFPEDRSLVVVVEVTSTGQSALVRQLLEAHPGVFSRIPPHVTRKPRDGEVNGQDCHFVDHKTFKMMRDGDQLLAFDDTKDEYHGTSRRLIEAESEAGKVPVAEMDRVVSFCVSMYFCMLATNGFVIRGRSKSRTWSFQRDTSSSSQSLWRALRRSSRAIAV